MRSGNEKAKVFPEPVNAIPIISRPENLYLGALVLALRL